MFLKKNLLAIAEIPSVLPLELMARTLEVVIDGIVFNRDETGRFDEVPVFIANDVNSSMEFILFGIPDGESGTAYTLEVSAETELPIENFRKSTLKFVNNFIGEKKVNCRGYYDYSDELVNALNKRGVKTFKQIP